LLLLQNLSFLSVISRYCHNR